MGRVVPGGWLKARCKVRRAALPLGLLGLLRRVVVGHLGPSTGTRATAAGAAAAVVGSSIGALFSTGAGAMASKAAVGLTVAALGVAGPLAMDDTTGPQRWHPNSTDVSTVASATRGAAMLPLHTRSSLAKPVLSLPDEQAGATRTTRAEPMGVESLVPIATTHSRLASRRRARSAERPLRQAPRNRPRTSASLLVRNDSGALEPRKHPPVTSGGEPLGGLQEPARGTGPRSP